MAGPPSPPIDFSAIRVAFSRALQQALGLPSNQVICLQAESVPAPRPILPFAGYMLTNLGQSFGSDAVLNCYSDSNAFAATGTFVYAGPRMLSAMFQFYGETHEQAYAYCSAWHAALDQDPTQALLLGLGGLSVWQRQPPTDVSAMLFTGTEGRASFSCTFGVQALSTVTLGTIESVPVAGQTAGDGTVSLTVTGPED